MLRKIDEDIQTFINFRGTKLKCYFNSIYRIRNSSKIMLDKLNSENKVNIQKPKKQ